MENDKKKPTFEPVSAEEAKRIRAYNGGESMTSGSGVECTSGSTDPYAVCQLSHYGQECCYLRNGEEIHGVCDWAGGFVEVGRLVCTDHPSGGLKKTKN